MDRITSMQIFVKVAEVGSFAAAAGELKLSPAMVAKHIRSLEDRLQISLIRRTTRQRPRGAVFFQKCELPALVL